MEKLRESLDMYNVQTLREMMSALGISMPAGQPRKGWMIDKLEREIVAQAGSREKIAALSEPQRTLLWILFHALLQEVPLSNLSLPLIKAGIIDVDEMPAKGKKLPTLDRLLQPLLERGLVINLTQIPGSGRRKFTPVATVGLAPEVKRALPENLLIEPQARADVQHAPDPEVVFAGDGERFLRDIFFFWAEMRRQPAYLLKNGGIGKRDLRRIAQSLNLTLDDNVDKLEWMYALLKQLKLMEERESNVVAVENDAALDFWQLSPAERVGRLIEVYPWLSIPVQVSIREVYKYAYYTYPTPRESSKLRSSVLEIIRETMPAGWFPLGLLLTFLTAGKPGSFIFNESTLDAMQGNTRWMSQQQSNQLVAAVRTVEVRAFNSVLQELNQMGLIDLGLNAEQSRMESFRPTAYLRAIYEKDAPALESTGEWQVILKPDFEILAMGPIPLSVLATLEMLTDREKVTEGVYTYRLTRDSAYRALQQGLRVDKMLALFGELSSQPVPQNVERTLEEWGEQYERIVLRRNISILQTDRPELLEQLLSDPVVGRFLHALDEHTAWVSSRYAKRVGERLQEIEILPTYSRGPEADLPRSLQWEGDRLRPRHASPSLFVRGTIRRLAEEDARGWQITPQSIRQVVATGMTVPDIIETLEQMTGGQISPAWKKRLKAWGGHFGDAQHANLLLLRMGSGEALEELRSADRQLHRWLRPLVPGEGLAVVDERHWEEAQALLEEWGVSVEAGRWW